MLDEKKKNYYSGILMLCIGIATTYGSLGHKIGTLSRMGPGYFPLMLGVALIVVSIIILLTGFFQIKETGSNEENNDIEPKQSKSYLAAWRAPLCVIAGVVLFIVLGKYGGLMLATFAVVFMSALGDPDNSIKTSLLAALLITVFAVIVFHFGLRMQFPLITWG